MNADYLKDIIKKLITQVNLSEEEMTNVMQHIMRGEAEHGDIVAFLKALAVKGETVTELAAAVKVMREFATKVDISDEKLIDVAGTGGDGNSTFNISTACAFVVAAAGGKVAKHGNRSLSSNSGSADVLEAAGVNIQLNPEQVAQCVEQINIGFMFAPNHHAATKHVADARREIGRRTIFNLLGPLTNPADAQHQVVGVFSGDWLQPVAKTLQSLGCQHALVVHSKDGLDEISVAANTDTIELKNGELIEKKIIPEKFDVHRHSLKEIKAKNAQDSLRLINEALCNTPGAAHDIIVLNAGAAIYIADLVDSMEAGVEKAKEVISSGKAKEKLQQLIELTQAL